MDYTPQGERTTLYRPHIDKVINLDQSNFEQCVLNSSIPTLVEVYKDWCGHCRKFLRIYRTFGLKSLNWQDKIRVAAINCADLNNLKICKTVLYALVPLINLYPANINSLNDTFLIKHQSLNPNNPHQYDIGLKNDKDRYVEKLRSVVVQRLVQPHLATSIEESPLVPKTVNLTKNHTSRKEALDEIWKNYAASENTSHLVFVSKEPVENGTINATQVKWDLVPYQGIEVLALQVNSSLAELLDVMGSPRAALFEKGNEKALYVDEERINDETVKNIVKFANFTPVLSELPSNKPPPLQFIDCEVEENEKDCIPKFFVSEKDMLMSLRMILYDEILFKGEVKGENVTNLRAFVHSLVEVDIKFPLKTYNKTAKTESPLPRSQQAHKLFKLLFEFLYAKQNGSFTGDEWREVYLASENKTLALPHGREGFEHCKGTSIEFRGFTCGLWNVFHALTINAYLNAQNQTSGQNVPKEKALPFDPVAPLNVIKGWVYSFFTCQSCREHFLEESTMNFTIDHTNVKIPEDSFLYLWKFHNHVNIRLGKQDDPTNDPQFRKVNFPPTFLCPDCDFKIDSRENKVLHQFLINYYTNIKPYPLTICFSFLTVALVIVNAQNTTHAPCGTNEEFNECGTACEPSCLNTSPEVCNFSCTPNVCRCLLGYVRNSEGGCVASSDCPTEASTEAPEATSCGQNEVLHECASGCEPSCADPSPVCALQCLAHTLLNRNDTIRYLRIYHLAVGGLMMTSAILMIKFMYRAHLSLIPKLKRPHKIPRPTLASGFVLTVGVSLGYAYLLVFHLGFSNCDKLIDAYSDEQWEDLVYSCLMIGFCLLSSVYIIQRSYYGSVEDSKLDLITRRWVNVVLTIVWIKIVLFKGYLSYQEVCQRIEISGMWCPAKGRPYECHPEQELKGTQLIWYYLHKGLLNSTVISCASEYFPVMLVGHWLACGRADEKADELIQKRRKEEKKSIRRARQSSEFKKPDVKRTMPALKMRCFMKSVLVALAWLAFIMSLFRWCAAFYFNICFDEFHKTNSLLDDYSEFWAISALFVFYSMLFKWSLSVNKRRLDLHHRAQSKGDMALLFGSAVFMAFKLILQVTELNLQRMDGFISIGECFIRSSALIMTHISEWLQLFCLRSIIALHLEDIQECRIFLPSVAVSSILVNWVSFATTFFETNLIKYQLGKPEYYFSQRTLISMIFTQTIYPADYLFTFTAAGCWADVLVRYIELGYFQLGKVQPEENMSLREKEDYGAAPDRPNQHLCVPEIQNSEQPKFQNLNMLYSQRRVHYNDTPKAITFTLPDFTDHSKNVDTLHPLAHCGVCSCSQCSGVCSYPRSFRQLMLAANPNPRCRDSDDCTTFDKPFCVKHLCEQHPNPGYRLASYEVNSLGCYPPCQYPSYCDVMRQECVL
uniref:Sulfhydryl oxidase n=1 Tax=Ditylenchus dipsaci TaxID=166011 RepID=A0A915E935_9BILA